MKTVTFQRNDDVSTDLASFHDVTIDAPLEKLVSMFGEPIFEEGGKVTHEWILEGNDGTVVTVYDYRFNGAHQRYWHVGGADKLACLKFSRWFNSQ